MAVKGSNVLCGSIPESADFRQSSGAAPTRSALRVFAFFGAFALFGVVGTATSLACLVPAIWFRTRRARQAGQNFIHRLFRFFLWYLDRCGIAVVDAKELVPLSNAAGAILVANHPSYLDAVMIAAKIPNVCCLMKSSLVGNVVLSGQSRLAGYVDNKAGSGLVKTCICRLQEGSNLLIFPEGTRSDGALGPCKRGFALLARVTERPVQTIIVEVMPPGFLGKRTPFFRVPELPVRYRLRRGKVFSILPSGDAKSLGKDVEDYLRDEVRAISIA